MLWFCNEGINNTCICRLQIIFLYFLVFEFSHFWQDSSQMYRSKTKKNISVKECYSMKKDELFFSPITCNRPCTMGQSRKQLFTQRDQNIRTTRNPRRLGISDSEKLSNAWNWWHNHSVSNFQKVGDWSIWLCSVSNKAKLSQMICVGKFYSLTKHWVFLHRTFLIGKVEKHSTRVK